MRVVSLVSAFIVSLCVTAGCAPKQASRGSGLNSFTAQQSAALFGGNRDALGNRTPSAWERLTKPISNSLSRPAQQVVRNGDPIRLSEPVKTSPQLHVAMAKAMEKSGKLESAAEQVVP